MALYDELGGAAAVDISYRRMLGDERVARFFDGVDMDKQAAKQ